MSSDILMPVGDFVESRELTGYPACRPEVVASGGEWREVAMHEAVTDGNLVTAPAWSAHVEWLRAFLEVLGTRIEHREPAAV